MLRHSSRNKTSATSGRGGALFKNKATTKDLKEEEETCPICFDTLAKKPQGGKVLRSSWVTGSSKVWCDCGHYFCEDCLGLYVATSINEGETVKNWLRCPIENCKVPIKPRLMQQLVGKADWAKHLRLVKERKLEKDPLRRWCPKPHCNSMIRLSQAPADPQQYLPLVCGAQDCGHAFCGNCGCAPHPDTTCDNAGDKAYFSWKRKMGAKQVKPCPNCRRDTEKRGGCSSMYCTHCRTHWCWTCGNKQARNGLGCTCYALNPAHPQFWDDLCFYLLFIPAMAILFLGFLLKW